MPVAHIFISFARKYVCLICLILFWKKNPKVISFLRKLNKDTKNQKETLPDNPFGNIPKPKQTVDPSLDAKSKRWKLF